MKNFERINVTAQVRRCLERANIISCLFNDEYVRTAYVMLSIFNEPNTLLDKCLMERGIRPIPNYIVTSLLDDK